MKTTFEISPDFTIRTIVSVKELMSHDLIYIYHHLHIGAIVQLDLDGENVKGEPSYSVRFKGFLLGFITISGAVRSLYEGVKTFEGEVSDLNKQKFLPIKGIDLSLQATKMRMVS